MIISKLSLKNRLLLIFSLTFILFFGTYTKIQFDILNDTMQFDVEDDMKSLAGFLSSLVEIEIKGAAGTKKEIKSYITSKLIPILNNLKLEMFGPTSLYALVTDADNTPMLKSDHLKLWTPEEWKAVRNSKVHFRDLIINGKKYHSGRFFFNISGKYELGLELALNVDEPIEEFSRMSSNIMLGLIIGIALSIFITFLLTPVVFSHIKKMTKNASTINARNLSKRIELPESKDELHNLGTVINSMLDRIAGSFESQKRFVADASHELKTPLTIIQAELEISLKKAEIPEVKESIKIVLEEIAHLTNLTSSLLSMVKLDNRGFSETKEEFFIDELLADAIRSFSHLLSARNISIAQNINNGILIEADREGVKRLIINLIDNAVKYSKSNSLISISLQPSNGDSIKLTVKDNGAGMSDDTLKNIFKPFYRAPATRSEVQGTGLGLPIVKKIADLHNGSINISSTPGKGTSVEVILKKVSYPQNSL